MEEKNHNLGAMHHGRALDTLLRHGWVENTNYWLPGFYWHMACGKYSLRKGFAKLFKTRGEKRFVIKEVCMNCKREVITYQRKF